MEKKLRLSVHQLVDFLLRRGDIDNRIFNQASMSEGSRLHAYYQKLQSSSYHSEYYLRQCFIVDDFEVTIEGRADGIIDMPFHSVIDEIKTTVIDLEECYETQGEWHLGQAKCYALMYAVEKSLTKIGVKLTYIHQLNKEQIIKQFDFETSELEIFVLNLIKEYLIFYKMLFDLKIARNKSAKELQFPFENFRQGQRDLAKYTYNTLNNGGIMYVEAPTGIGKTMSTLFPAIKTFVNEENDKIFYLTAKNSGRESAFKAGLILKEKGLEAHMIIISAKDKMCACPGRSCNPDDCPFAKGYYDKIRIALTDAITSVSTFDANAINNVAMKYAICPFEFELDLSLFCDLIICDFNYLFDPIVYLRRYFDGDASKYVALIDEAHNLLERGRDMYTKSISYVSFLKMKKAIKGIEHKKLNACVRKIAKYFKDVIAIYQEGNYELPFIDAELIKVLNNFLKASQDFMKKHPFGINDDFKNFFFEVNKFIKILDFYEYSFTCFVKVDKFDRVITIFSLDPSKLIKQSLDLLKGAVLFSGTLSPLDYYVKMLGGNDQSPVLKIPSPFPKDNLLLMIAPTIATTYKKRDSTIEQVSDYIKKTIEGKIGNYFVFFPSYVYLESVLSTFKNHSFNVHVQSREMNDDDKTKFLQNFVENPSETNIAFVVLGGSFSEGIDLLSDRLIGAIVVGVGLPQISFERDLIREYFDKNEQDGFEFSYVNPGMNRVMQAAGRVIRSSTDRGIVLLIDDRYLQKRYRNLFKSEWNHYEVVTTLDDITTLTTKFWAK